MIQVINKNGDPIKGLFRSPDGALIVNDPVKYSTAMADKKQETEIADLKEKVNKMEMMMEAIYNKLFLEK